MARHHLVQLNLGLFRAPLDDEEMAEFRLALDPINALAESTPGFIWRLKDDAGGSSSFVEVRALATLSGHPLAARPTAVNNETVYLKVLTSTAKCFDEALWRLPTIA